MLHLGQTGVTEFSRDPILTVACVLVIVVAIAWIVVSRMIARNLKRADAIRDGRAAARTTRRVWDQPPP